jgi:hypothetical protein
MQNLKYSILLMGLGDAEQPYLTMARMEDRQGGNTTRDVSVYDVYAMSSDQKVTKSTSL